MRGAGSRERRKTVRNVGNIEVSISNYVYFYKMDGQTDGWFD
jgi:hypothetical protein